MNALSTRTKVAALLISVLIVATVPVLLSDALIDEYDRTDIAQIAAEGEVRNCESDRKFRVQYQERARAERQHLGLESKSNEYIALILRISLRSPDPDDSATPAEIRFVRRATRAFARTALQEKKLAKLIRIIPIRECGELRSDIAGTRRD